VACWARRHARTVRCAARNALSRIEEAYKGHRRARGRKEGVRATTIGERTASAQRAAVLRCRASRRAFGCPAPLRASFLFWGQTPCRRSGSCFPTSQSKGTVCKVSLGLMLLLRQAHRTIGRLLAGRITVEQSGIAVLRSIWATMHEARCTDIASLGRECDRSSQEIVDRLSLVFAEQTVCTKPQTCLFGPCRNHNAHPGYLRPRHAEETPTAAHPGNAEPTRACSEATPCDRGASGSCAQEHQGLSCRVQKQHCVARQRRRLLLPVCREAQGQHSRAQRRRCATERPRV